MKTLPILLLPLAAMAAEPEARLEPVESEACAWRLSVGYRAAPGIKASASVDARAAAAAAGGVLRPGRGGGSSSGGAASVSAKTEDLGTETSGMTADEAERAAGWSADKKRWDFDYGYIDLDDKSLREGETQNWHFESADDFVDGAVKARTSYSSTTTSRTRTTTTETSGSSSTSRSVSLREEWGDDLRDSSEETAPGIELRLDRTVWEDADFGVDIGFGYAWYDDVDCFSIRGRAYSAAATEKCTASTTPSGSRVTTTETTTTTTESGTVVTSITQPEFTDPADYVNDDGSASGSRHRTLLPLPGVWEFWRLRGTPRCVLCVSLCNLCVEESVREGCAGGCQRGKTQSPAGTQRPRLPLRGAVGLGAEKEKWRVCPLLRPTARQCAKQCMRSTGSAETPGSSAVRAARQSTPTVSADRNSVGRDRRARRVKKTRRRPKLKGARHRFARFSVTRPSPLNHPKGNGCLCVAPRLCVSPLERTSRPRFRHAEAASRRDSVPLTSSLFPFLARGQHQPENLQ